MQLADDQSWQDGYDAGIAKAAERLQLVLDGQDFVADPIECEPLERVRQQILALMADARVLAGFRNALAVGGVKGLIIKTAQENGGIVRGRDIANLLRHEGHFRDNRHADAQVYMAIKRLGLFEKIEPGVYRLREEN